MLPGPRQTPAFPPAFAGRGRPAPRGFRSSAVASSPFLPIMTVKEQKEASSSSTYSSSSTFSISRVHPWLTPEACTLAVFTVSFHPQLFSCLCFFSGFAERLSRSFLFFSRQGLLRIISDFVILSYHRKPSFLLYPSVPSLHVCPQHGSSGL